MLRLLPPKLFLDVAIGFEPPANARSVLRPSR